MKICRFRRPDQSLGWGLLNKSGIQDITIADSNLPVDTLTVLQQWAQLKGRVEYLSKRLGTVEEDYKILSPLSTLGKILCIGLNYRDHAEETKAAIPTEPIVFCKMSTAVIGPDDDIQLPAVSQSVDFEAELVVVIGKTMKHVTEVEASDGIFGYTVGNDVSARDWQKNKPGKQWFLGKTFDTFAPLGPAIVLKEVIADPHNLSIQCHVNAEQMQNGNTKDLIFKPAELVAYVSQVMTLNAGDLIFTGTPAGVGMARTPPVFLRPGDEVKITIEQVGTLINRCV